jgi:hypothetical protein
MFYLAYVMFLFVGHCGLSVAIGVASWGVARSGSALDSRSADVQRGLGGGSRGVGRPEEHKACEEAPKEQDGSSYKDDSDKECAPQGGPAATVADQLQVS